MGPRPIGHQRGDAGDPSAPRHGASAKAPLSDDDIEAMVGTLGDDIVGLRDRALLAMGWMGAFRRCELVALTVEDVR